MTILVLVADGAYAKLYTTRSQTGALDLWEEYAHPASRLRNAELTSDGPGIGQDSIGQGRHSMGHEREAPQHEAQQFAIELATKLHSSIAADDIHKIYLIAPPRFLGRLRDAISPQVRQRVAAEIDHDLVHHSAADIRGHLPQYL